MGLIDKIGIFGNGDDPEDTENGTEDQFYNKSKEEFHMENGVAGSRMMLLEPRAYSESQQIADYLKNRSAVVVNLKRVTPDQAKRIVDFLYGTIYAIGGELQKLGGGIFLCTPNNVNVEGTISEENNKDSKNSKKKDQEDEDYFN